MSGAAANDSKVETISRLAQWRIDSFGPCSYRRSDAFKLGLWNWFLSVEKNRYMYIRLFPEPCKVSKEQPPIARFVVRVSGPGPGHRPHVSPDTYPTSSYFWEDPRLDPGHYQNDPFTG